MLTLSQDANNIEAAYQVLVFLVVPSFRGFLNGALACYFNESADDAVLQRKIGQ